MYHERRLPTLVVWLKDGVRLSSINDAIEAVWDSFGDEQPALSPRWSNLSPSSLPPAAGDNKGH